MSAIGLALRAARELGPAPLLQYALYQLEMRSGWTARRCPSYTWDARPLAYWSGERSSVAAPSELYSRHFFFDPERDFRSTLSPWREAILAEADEILAGNIRLFGGDPVALGSPPDWGRFAPLGENAGHARLRLDHHWATYNLEDLPADIKLLWEPSRFGWAYVLGRAFRASGKTRYFDALCEWVDSWRAANQPNQGPHWISGQEVGLRLMALGFAVHAFSAPFAQAPGRLETILQTIAIHAARIPPTLRYARAQGNNHLLVEALALLTAGTMLPGVSQARGWRNLGRRWLDHALRTQFFPDGGYVQHSTNYHRLAVEAGLWALRLAEVSGEPLSSGATIAHRRGAQLLAALVDPSTGQAPNLGPNDGARILPLSTTRFEDHRPALQSASLLHDRSPLYAEGAWDEMSVWLGIEGRGAELVGEPRTDRRQRSDFPQAGLFLSKGATSWGLLRCARFRNRPGHSDQLHVDLWWRGQNILRDAGTYLYNGTLPWENALAAAQVHNTVLLDREEPMRRAGRFLWLDWAQGRFDGRWTSPSGRLEAVAGSHDGFRGVGVRHRRLLLRVGDEHWWVVDELLGEGAHHVRHGWLLPDAGWDLEGGVLRLSLDGAGLQLESQVDGAELDLLRAGVSLLHDASAAPGVLGWESPTYAVKRPALFLVAAGTQRLPLRAVTRISLGGADPRDVELSWRSITPERVGLAIVTYQDEQLAL